MSNTLIILYIFLFILSFFLSFLFSFTEVAVISLGQDRTKQLVEEGGFKGKMLSFWQLRSNGILISILLWDTIINTFVITLSTVVVAFLFTDKALFFVMPIITALIFFFGEVLPKTVAKNHAEAFAHYGIQFFKPFYYITYPFTLLVEKFLAVILGRKAHLEERVTTQDDIEYLVNKAGRDQTLNEVQVDLLNSALEVPMLRVQDVMRSLPSINAIFINDTYLEIIEKIKQEALDFYPVFEDQEFLGVIELKKFLINADENQYDLFDFIQKPLQIFQKIRIQKLFEEMRNEEIDVASVYDENHLLVGIITIDDIIHQISGSLKKEMKEHVKTQKGYMIPGTISLLDLYSEYGIDLPQEEHFSTLNGFILDILGNDFPKVNQFIYFQDYVFEIYKVVDYKILEVLVRIKEE